MTLLDAIKRYEAIRTRIRTARIGIGVNKCRKYGSPARRKRRVMWANELAEATRLMEQFVKDAAYLTVAPCLRARVCTEPEGLSDGNHA